MKPLGIVAIGRNEGDRLRRCLESVIGPGRAVVYVDSGSTDGSVALARSLGAEVVELDLSIPFTAARRATPASSGWSRSPRGSSWSSSSTAIARWRPAGWSGRPPRWPERPEVAVVAGRRRERHPDQTIYNRLADLEWDSPIGEADGCGGDAMVRASAFRRAGGYDPTIIAGEEPELCLRLRRDGWKVLRLDAEMTVHDMAHDPVRAVVAPLRPRGARLRRGGGAARPRPGTALDPRGPRHPALGHRPAGGGRALAWPTRGLSLVLLAGYPALFVKTARYYRRVRGWPAPDARLYAAACVVGKFPQALGLAKYWSGRHRRASQPDHRIQRGRCGPGRPADPRLGLRPAHEPFARPGRRGAYRTTSMSIPASDRASGTDHPTSRVAVAATFTAEPVQEALDFWMGELGLPASVEFAPYNQVFQQLLDPMQPALAEPAGGQRRAGPAGGLAAAPARLGRRRAGDPGIAGAERGRPDRRGAGDGGPIGRAPDRRPLPRLARGSRRPATVASLSTGPPPGSSTSWPACPACR